MIKEKRPPIDWDKALRLREQEGWAFARLAREFGYSYKTVRRGLLLRGAHRRRPGRHDRRTQKLREIWRYTHEKCELPHHSSFKLNGALGARVSDAWMEFEPFRAWALAAGFKVGLRLALNDERKPYGPDNCRWITAAERVRTRKPRVRRAKSRKPPRPIDWELATRLYLEEGLSLPEVARQVGASYTGVITGFKRLRIKRPERPAATSRSDEIRLRKAWWSMHSRCSDPTNPGYKGVGGRGLKVAREWTEFEPFLSWALESGASRGKQLARVDPQKGYSPQNCAWLTHGEAQLHRRRPDHGPGPRRLISALGELKGLMEWSRDPRCSVSAPAIARRLALGWDRETAITAPAESPGPKGMIQRGIRAFGVVKGLTAWIEDPRCKVGSTGLSDRLRRGWSAEDAISTPAFGRPAGAPGGRRGRAGVRAT